MMQNILPQLTRDLFKFLDNGLSKIRPNYWDAYVLTSLSSNQKKIVEQKGISSIKQLDLAALLTVFDKNWSELCFQLTLPFDGKIWLREMVSIRNKYSHLSSDSNTNENIIREYDTALRFGNMINADSMLIEYIEEKQNEAIINASKAMGLVKNTESAPPVNTVNSEIGIGQLVNLKTNTTIAGVVTKVIPSSPENRYEVFINNQMQTLYESQIEILHKDETSKNVKLHEFHANLSSILINNPGMSTLYSLHSARINFVPFQFRPVLKFIHSDRPRLLIADEVGVGKTIESGLILRELQARSNVSSVLIICPKALVTEHKWQTEMKRFDESFTELDGRTLRFCISELDLEGKWPSLHEKTILPFSLFDEALIYGADADNRKNSKALVSLDPPPKFDLVIVDEAHHLRNANTFVHQGVKYFCDNAEAVVFLTATPIQLGQNDLYVLLNLLRPDLVIDQDSFVNMSEPNPYLNKAIDLARSAKEGWFVEALENMNYALTTNWGSHVFVNHPEFNLQIEKLKKQPITEESRISFIREVEELHTFAGIINRTRRRDIGEFTTRKSETIEIEFTEEQRILHDVVLETQAQILKMFHEDKSINFMMSTIRRQVASCLHGLIPYLRDILSRRISLLEYDDEDEFTENENVSQNLSALKTHIEQIINKAEQLPLYDPKYEALVKIVRDKQGMPNNKLLLFSTFRHTLSYLYEKLAEEGIRVGLITGDSSEFDRRDLRKRFSESKELPNSIDILLSSEVGCEGLDYQFCDCLINYDLPWNPMRIEQRIGRIDRYGQKSESIAIYNFITPGTVEGDIYERCLLRIGVFQNAIGGSEEILGQISSEIKNIANDLTLSSTERQNRLQQIADNQIRLIQEQMKLEEKQVELFGINLPPKLILKKIEDANSFWLSPRSLQNMIEVYISRKSEADQCFLSDKAVKTLRLNQKSRNRLLEDLNTLISSEKYAIRRNQTTKEWMSWLKSDNPLISVTFEDSIANNDRAATFITPIHPLARQAANELSVKDKIFITTFQVSSNILPKGEYPFAIYEWKKTGIKSDIILKPICYNEEISNKLLELLELGIDSSLEKEISKEQIEELDKLQYELWSIEKKKHIEFNELMSTYRKQSLITSNNARINQLEEQLNLTTEEKIKRMKLSQLNTVKADYDRRLSDMEKAIAASDVLSTPIAYGIMTIKGEEI